MALSLADLHKSGGELSGELEAHLEREDSRTREHENGSGGGGNGAGEGTAFEVYDPRGLFSARRRTSTGKGSRLNQAAAVNKTSQKAGQLGITNGGQPGHTSSTSPVAVSGTSSPANAQRLETAITTMPTSASPIPISAKGTPFSASPTLINAQHNQLPRLQTWGKQDDDGDGVAAMRGRKGGLEAIMHGGGVGPDIPGKPSSAARARNASPNQIPFPYSPSSENSGMPSFISRSSDMSTSAFPAGDAIDDTPVGGNGEPGSDDDGDGEGTVLSPAAEFLGSFSASSSLMGGVNRARSGTSLSFASRPRAGSNVSNRSQDTPSQAMSMGGSATGSGINLAASFLREAGRTPSFSGAPAGARPGGGSGWNRSFIAPDPDEEGQEVDGYILQELLGHGTFSVVRKAKHLDTGEEVAVKIVRHPQFQFQNGSGGGTGNVGMGVGMSGLGGVGIGLWAKSRETSSHSHDDHRMTSSTPSLGPAFSARPSDAGAAKKEGQVALGRSNSHAGPNASTSRPLPNSMLERLGSAYVRTRACSSPSMTLQQPTFFNDGKHTIDGLPPTSYGSGDNLISEVDEDMDSETPVTRPVGLPGFITDGDGDPSNTKGHHADEADDEEDRANGNHSLADPALQKEVYIWSQLSEDDHPHILPLLHFYESDFASFIFMPLCKGNLLQYVKDFGKGGSKSPEQGSNASGTMTAFVGSPPKLSGVRGSPSLSRSPPPQSMSASSLNRSGSITSSVSSSSNTSNSNSHSGSTVQGKVTRSGSIRLRHPHEVVRGGTGLALPLVKKIFAQIVSGLEHLHTVAKVTHKDIKLENILLDGEAGDSAPHGSQDGGIEDLCFRISDFGLAHATTLLGGGDVAAMAAASANSKNRFGIHSRRPSRYLDAKSRREHALSDGDAQDIISSSAMTITPGSLSVLPSLGEAASRILPPTVTPPLPESSTSRSPASPLNSIPPFANNTPSSSLPDESLLELTQSAPASRVVGTASRSSLAAKRSHVHAIPASLAHMQSIASKTFGDATAGSLQYTSPEQIRSPSPITDASVDIWALGCVLYAMIEGRLPFDDGFEPRLRVQIMKGEWKRPTALQLGDSQQGPSSSEATDEEKEMIYKVLEGCLEVDPVKRWTIETVAQCRWLQGSVLPSPMSPGMSRGRTRDTAHDRRFRGVQGFETLAEADAREEDHLEMSSRSRSRGRPAYLHRDPSQTPQQRGRPGTSGSTHSGSGSGSRSRRGPSVDDYRRARAENDGRSSSRSGNAHRSRSGGRHYGGESVTSWEIL